MAPSSSLQNHIRNTFVSEVFTNTSQSLGYRATGPFLCKTSSDFQIWNPTIPDYGESWYRGLSGALETTVTFSRFSDHVLPSSALEQLEKLTVQYCFQPELAPTFFNQVRWILYFCNNHEFLLFLSISVFQIFDFLTLFYKILNFVLLPLLHKMAKFSWCQIFCFELSLSEGKNQIFLYTYLIFSIQEDRDAEPEKNF